jgi:molybdenum cofactor guanylyltransferase
MTRSSSFHRAAGDKGAGVDNLTGVVLCGGESQRMGRDKGLLEKDGVPWAIRMGQKLAPWQVPVVYSINEKQWAAYITILSTDQLILDALGLPGPLDGLLSVHQRFPNQDLLLLACDMQDLDAPTIGQLLDAYRQQPEGSTTQAFFAYRDSGRFQPFCAIYTANGLAPAYRLAQTESLQDFSLQALLKSGKTAQLTIGDPQAFHNYNS